MRNSNFIRLPAAVFLGGALIAGCATGEEPLADVGQLSAATTSELAPLSNATHAKAIPGEFIVKFQDGVTEASKTAIMNRVTLRGDESNVQRAYQAFSGFAGELSPAALLELRADPAVAYIEANLEVSIETVYDAQPDGLDRVDQRALPLDGSYDDYGNDGAGVNVYIVDTGIRTTHAEFTGRIGSTADFVGDGQNGEDCNGHGTHVASTAAGTTYGLAKAATLHGVRVLNCSGSGTYAGVIAGIDHVRLDCPTRPGPCVGNMSLGGGFSQAVNDAVADAVASGVSFAVAAGNESTDACNRSPASAPSALTVGAADDSDGLAYFSNVGTCVDIFAPGVSILGADIGSDTDTQTISGTSMASPHVAGAVAQYLGNHPDATAADVQAAMIESSTAGCIADLDLFTKNLLLFNDFTQSGEGQGCSGSANSCAGNCGAWAPGGCYCDKDCKKYGDCCEDKVEACGN